MKNFFNKCVSFVSSVYQKTCSYAKEIVVGTAATVTTVSAMADEATDTVVTAAITAAGTSVATFGAALVGLAVVGVGFSIGIKYVKKARGAA